MRYLVAPNQPGDQPDDVTGTAPGEWLYLPIECDTPGCLCGRVFRGLTTGHLTTTAVVADVDADEATLLTLTRHAVAQHYRVSIDHIPADEALDAVRMLSGLAYLHTPGDVVRVTHILDDTEG